VTVNELEERLRKNVPPVIARIRENVLLLDARTIRDKEIGLIVKAVSASLAAG
jgi:seryl-tRNA(Sec) selenium transferase